MMTCSCIDRGLPNLMRQLADFMGRSQGQPPFFLAECSVPSPPPHASDWPRSPSAPFWWLVVRAVCHMALSLSLICWGLSVMQPHPSLPIRGEGQGYMTKSPLSQSSARGRSRSHLAGSSSCQQPRSALPPPPPVAGLQHHEYCWLPLGSQHFNKVFCFGGFFCRKPTKSHGACHFSWSPLFFVLLMRIHGFHKNCAIVIQ